MYKKVYIYVCTISKPIRTTQNTGNFSCLSAFCLKMLLYLHSSLIALKNAVQCYVQVKHKEKCGKLFICISNNFFTAYFLSNLEYKIEILL